MAKKVTIAIITEKLNGLLDLQSDVVTALLDGGFVITDIIEREKLKDGKWCTWLALEKCEVQWCNVCGETTATHRMRCVTCGAKRGSY